MLLVKQTRLEDDKVEFAKQNVAAVRAQYDELYDKIETLEQKSLDMQSKLNKLHKLESCPICLQGIAHDHKESIGKKFLIEQESIAVELLTLKEQFSVVSENQENLAKAERYLDVTEMSINNELKDIKAEIKVKEAAIEKIKADSGDLDEESKKLKQIAENALKLITRKNELSEQKQLQEISLVLLKDNGIKTAIIREYLPVLNKLINKYLNIFDFFVNFNLDESFSEVIKSRGRDEFSYASFSEGEKKRLDLAILLAFRQIAAMKNSAKVNLIIFDEVVDSSLDLEARAKFTELLSSLNDSNVFVISHTDTSPEAYDSVIRVEKHGDFSTYEYI
jgi:DNA repair exonuclease SbcCD ATPase subunit